MSSHEFINGFKLFVVMSVYKRGSASVAEIQFDILTSSGMDIKQRTISLCIGSLVVQGLVVLSGCAGSGATDQVYCLTVLGNDQAIWMLNSIQYFQS